MDEYFFEFAREHSTEFLMRLLICVFIGVLLGSTMGFAGVVVSAVFAFFVSQLPYV